MLDEAGSQQLAGEPLQVFMREPVRSELFFEFLLRLLHGVLAVEHLDDEILLLVEAVITQRDRVLYDVALLALIFLLSDVEVSAHHQPDLLAAFVLRREGQFHDRSGYLAGGSITMVTAPPGRSSAARLSKSA